MKNRYLSLDVFRGATVALMILVNNPGSFDHIFPSLDHAEWQGCTLADLVFPFFLFAVGNAMAFAFPSLKEKGDKEFYIKVIRRSLLIFMIGLMLSWIPFFKWDKDVLIFREWSAVRIMGVLQRIAVCYLLASLIVHHLDVKKAAYFGLCLLAGYWALSFFYGSADAPYSLEGHFGSAFDKAILGEKHMYHGEKNMAFDPEGIASTMAAIAQVIFGYVAGAFIISKGKTPEMLNRLFYMGVLCFSAGLLWGEFFPISKKIWTSSYTLYTTGLALLVISCLIYLIEFRSKKGMVITFFDVYGKNPLFIFVLSGLIPRLLGLIRLADVNQEGKAVMRTPLAWLYENIFKNISTNPNIGSFIYSLFFILVLWLIGWFLYRKKIYIKV